MNFPWTLGPRLTGGGLCLGSRPARSRAWSTSRATWRGRTCSSARIRAEGKPQLKNSLSAAASSAPSSPRGNKCPYTSAVIWIDRMAEAALHHLERKLKPAIGAAIDAPGGIEVAQGMQPGILRLACSLTTPAAICAGHKPGRTMRCGGKTPPRGIGEHEVELALWGRRAAIRARCSSVWARAE